MFLRNNYKVTEFLLKMQSRYASININGNFNNCKPPFNDPHQEEDLGSAQLLIPHLDTFRDFSSELSNTIFSFTLFCT